MPQYKSKINRRKKSKKTNASNKSIRRHKKYNTKKTHKYRRLMHKGGWSWPWESASDQSSISTTTSVEPKKYTESLFGNIFGKSTEQKTEQKKQTEVQSSNTPIINASS